MEEYDDGLPEPEPAPPPERVSVNLGEVAAKLKDIDDLKARLDKLEKKQEVRVEC